MGHQCCTKQKVKKGLWSPEEDDKLIKHINAHGGHGSWSSVPKLAGLERCGKSCRLRWINYLRPDLKRGSFTAQEEKIIINVHRNLGNRWAQIAKHLPGRTDNEVKNFWHSYLKKKLITQGIDPNTHNYILSPCQTNNNNNTNACNFPQHENYSTFFTSHFKDSLSDIKPTFVPPPSSVLNETTHTQTGINTFAVTDIFQKYETQNSNLIQEQNPNLSGFSLIDDSYSMWDEQIFMHQQVIKPEKGISTDFVDSLNSPTFESSNLDFVETSLMQYGMYYIV